MSSQAFRLETLVDFPDDAMHAVCPITARHVDSMMAALAAAGVRRVSWATYADGHGGYRIPAGMGDRSQANTYNNWLDYQRTMDGLGNPLRVAVDAGHRHGLEVYGYFKPYETGPGFVLPEGSPEAKQFGLLDHIGGRLAWMDPFVLAHPQLRILRRTDERSATARDATVCAIKLVKRDDAPTRITRERLQIWTSPDNYRFQRRDVSFAFAESVEPAPHDVIDLSDQVVTRKGASRRVITLSGSRFDDRYILLTTNFPDGLADFQNVPAEMMSALDANGREILGVFADESAIWMGHRVNFREWGVIFDHGWGQSLRCLDQPNESGRRGFIAFTRGRAPYLTGALCETESAVRSYWLQCVRETLDAGVDGIDIREEGHSTHTEYPSEYGFNPIVLEQCRRAGDTSDAAVARVRGDAYTEFLRETKRMIASRGKRMRCNLNTDFFRPDPPRNRLLAFPANIDFQWRQWIDEGLMDEALMRFYTQPFDHLFSDPVAAEMIERARRNGIPVSVNRYIDYDPAKQAAHLVEIERIRADERFNGFVLYESDAFMKATDEVGGYAIISDVIRNVGKTVTGAR